MTEIATILETMTVHLTEEQILRLPEVQEHFEGIKTLLDTRVFDMRNGQAILNFDNNGRLRTIEMRLKVYKS